MNFGRSVVRFFLVIAVIGLSSIPSQACQGPRALDLQNALSADIVFVGRLTAMKVRAPDRYPNHHRQIFNFSIEQHFHGDMPDAESISFRGFSRHESLPFDYGVSYVVILRHVDLSPRRQSRPDGQSVFSPRASFLSLAIEPCGAPYRFLSDSEGGRAIREIFDANGDPEAKAEFFAKSLGLDGRPIRF